MATPRKIRCSVERLVDHGGGVYTLEMVPEVPAPRFQPGQFLHLTIDPFDPSGFWPESRVFSIASPPDQRDRLRICYSVKGSYTQRMEKELCVGCEVWVKLPYGEFMIGGNEETVLFGGGTGFAAYSAYLGGLAASHSQPLHILYGARTPELLIFRDEAEAVARRVPATNLVLVAESEAPAQHGEKGVLSAALIWDSLRDSSRTVFYLSGPPVMLKALTQQLREHGVNPERIRIDAWE
jgi:NAD(P)H-flavin reductase